MSKAKEIAITAVQGIVATALVVGLFILFVWGTPDQMSAEYDWTVGVEEAEAARREPRSLVRTSWKSVGFYLPDREAEGRVLVTEWRR